MTHLIKLSPQHVWAPDGSPLTHAPVFSADTRYLDKLEIPHFLNCRQAGECSVIMPAAQSMESGDEITDEYHFSAVVTEVVERRPARGNWEEPRPDFVRLRYV